MQDRILELIARKLGGEASEDELRELNALLETYPQYNYFLEVTASLTSNKEHLEKLKTEKELVASSWSQLEAKLLENKETTEAGKRGKLISLYGRFLRVAAVLLLAVSATWYLLQKDSSKDHGVAKLHEIKLENGRTSTVSLPDGSIVRLNSGSKLTYSDSFVTSNERSVTLEGEGYFDIVKNPQRPFLVHTSGITVKVLGTKFNVRAYARNENIETTLFSGKVAVTLNNEPNKSIFLSPHEKLTVSKRSGVQRLKQKDTVNNGAAYQIVNLPSEAADTASAIEVAWMKDRLIFTKESFEQIASKMERWYNVKISFSNDALKKEALSGIIEHETIEQALRLLQMTTAFHYIIKNDEITITN